MTEAPTPLENAAPTLRLRGVGRRFGGLVAVRDVDLYVAHGERRAILGPNGAGKTTLFNVISGDLSASTGTVELFGTDVTHTPRHQSARHTANPSLDSHPTPSQAVTGVPFGPERIGQYRT
ncbi:MAG: ATP-binding cassette domain-containing protein, partial [Acidimicrobiia bacterium]